ncbi:hypothetical protein, partial [Bacillus pumilus]|uniref:hypothetical protein n=1 Tax=Bacillus pumilus TaxID=1408 RepID=UPI003F7C6469
NMRKTPSFRMLFSIIKWSGGKFKGKIKLPRFSRQPEPIIYRLFLFVHHIFRYSMTLRVIRYKIKIDIIYI